MEVPSDTVVQELKNVTKLYAEFPEDLAMAMAVYMLGFSTYKGFEKSIGQKIGFDGEVMLKRMYEYAQFFDKQ